MSTSFKNLKEALTLRSLVIYLLNILFSLREGWMQSSFRKGILQIKWLSFCILNVFFMDNLIFPLLSFIFNFVNVLSTNSLEKRRLVASILQTRSFNTKLVHIFYSTSPIKNISQRLNIGHRILSMMWWRINMFPQTLNINN